MYFPRFSSRQLRGFEEISIPLEMPGMVENHRIKLCLPMSGEWGLLH
jgi:hypothetical protein